MAFTISKVLSEAWKLKPLRALLLIVLAVAGFFFLIENINGRFHTYDFMVYFQAAEALRDGDKLYDVSFGLSSGFYKYSHGILYLIIPLTYLPYQVAASLFYALIAYVFIWLLCWLGLRAWPFSAQVYTQNRQDKFYKSPLFLVGILSVLFVASHFIRELHLGNVNLLLLCLLGLVLYSISKGKTARAGLWLGLALLIKPHFLLLLPLLVLRKEWRVLVFSIFGVLGGLFLPALWLGWSENYRFVANWLWTMAAHNQPLAESPNTIYGVINTLSGGYFAQFGYAFVLPVLSAVGFGVFWFYLKNKKIENTTTLKVFNFKAEYLLLIALVPTLVHTDTEHFILSLPIVFFILKYIFEKRTKYKLIALFTLVCFLLYGINTPDIFGSALSAQLNEIGILGVGNIGIVVLFLWTFSQTKGHTQLR